MFTSKSSGFTDTGLTNGITYYYWIEAILDGVTYLSDDAKSATPVVDEDDDDGFNINEDDYQTIYTHTDGTIYAVTKETMNWDDARAMAQAQGGDLVTIHSAAENELVAELLDGETAWLGASDDGDRIPGAFETVASSSEDGWRWVDGSELSYENWREPAPNNAATGADSEEDCLTMYDNNSDWNDLNCPERERLAVFEFSPVNLFYGLIGHYEFEDNADDSSGNGNDGTEYGEVSYVDGVMGQAASFDGVSTVKATNPFVNAEAPNELAVSLWAKITSDDVGTLVSILYSCNGISDDLFHITYYGDDNLQELQSNTFDNTRVTVDSSEIDFSEWNHVVINYKNDQLSIYANEILIDTEDQAEGTYDDSLNLAIGGPSIDSCLSDHRIDGLIDDVRIYNRALNTAEIQTLYELGDD